MFVLYGVMGLSVGMAGAVPYVMVRAFPASVRFSGLSFAYNVSYAVFGGLTLAVFVSGKDFSFLGPILMVCSFAALAVILVGVFMGFNFGLVFCGLMVALFSGYIIYDTSNVMHRYGTNEHVAASMALFGSAAMLFYYILRIFMIARDE